MHAALTILAAVGFVVLFRRVRNDCRASIDAAHRRVGVVDPGRLRVPSDPSCN